MSRIGKTIREIPNGVTITTSEDVVVVKGPKGELTQKLHPLISVDVADNKVSVKVDNEDSQEERAMWGTFSSILGNMIAGVTEGFKKQLEVNGVGYKVLLKGKDLEVHVGYSHPVMVKARTGITFGVEKNLITVEGIDKQLVGEVSANIRKIRKPEPYKGKGIKYIDEIIIRKAGKAAAKAAA